MNNNCVIPIIFSLFYIEPDIFLNKPSTNNFIIYLQEFIKYKILNKNYISTIDDLNICKQICGKLGVIGDNIPNIYLLMFKIFNMDEIEICGNKMIKIITISPKSNKYNSSIKKMLEYWQTNGDNTITNIPQFIFLNIVKDKKIFVDIQKKIKLNTNNNWGFYSALCKADDHYYVLLCKDNMWFVYNKNNNNLLWEVKMDDVEIVNNIKQDCIFVIYKIM
jgi:hypothetical protein